MWVPGAEEGAPVDVAAWMMVAEDAGDVDDDGKQEVAVELVVGWRMASAVAGGASVAGRLMDSLGAQRTTWLHYCSPSFGAFLVDTYREQNPILINILS